MNIPDLKPETRQMMVIAIFALAVIGAFMGIREALSMTIGGFLALIKGDD